METVMEDNEIRYCEECDSYIPEEEIEVEERQGYTVETCPDCGEELCES